MTFDERRRFDELLEAVLAELPDTFHALLEEAPLIVEDRPTRQMLEEMNLDPEQESLCGLYTGTTLGERSFAQGHDMPETIHIFREGIIDEAGGWEPWTDDDGHALGGDDEVRRQIRITILHEVGHHFGLEEEDLDDLGYA